MTRTHDYTKIALSIWVSALVVNFLYNELGSFEPAGKWLMSQFQGHTDELFGAMILLWYRKLETRTEEGRRQERRESES